MVDLLFNCLGDLLQPARIVKNDEHIVVDLVLREEDRVGGAPLADQLLVNVRPLCHEIALHHFLMLNPHRRGFDVAIIVCAIITEKENVEGVGSLQADS